MSPNNGVHLRRTSCKDKPGNYRVTESDISNGYVTGRDSEGGDLLAFG